MIQLFGLLAMAVAVIGRNSNNERECFRLESITIGIVKSLRIFAHRPANVWLKAESHSEDVSISVQYDEGDLSERNFTVAAVVRAAGQLDVVFAEPGSVLHNASTNILSPLPKTLCEANFDELPRRGPKPTSWAVPAIAALSTQNLVLAGAVAMASHIQYVVASSQDTDADEELFTTAAAGQSGALSGNGGSIYGVDADVRGGLIWAAQETGLRPELVSTERDITLIISAPNFVDISVAVPMNSPVRAVTTERFRAVVVDVVHDCSSDTLACAEDCVPWATASLVSTGVVPGFCTCVDDVRNVNNVSDLFDILCESDFRFGHAINKMTTTVLPILPTTAQNGTTPASTSASTAPHNNETNYFNYCMEQVLDEQCSRAVLDTAECLCHRAGNCSVEPATWLHLPAAVPSAAFFLPNEFYRPLCSGNDSADALLPVRIGAALLAPVTTSRAERDLQLRLKSRHTRNLSPLGVVCVKMAPSQPLLALASLAPCAESRNWGDDNCTALCPRKRTYFCPERADILGCLLMNCGERHHATIDALRECKTYCSDIDQCTAKTTYTVRMTADNEILPGTPCVERTNVSFVCTNVSTATGLFGIMIEEHSVISIVDLDESFITVAFSALGVAVVVVACAGLLLFLGLRDLKRAPGSSGPAALFEEMAEVHVVPPSQNGSHRGSAVSPVTEQPDSASSSSTSMVDTRGSTSSNTSTLALARQALEASREQTKRLQQAELQEQLQQQQQQQQQPPPPQPHDQDEHQRHHRRRRRRSSVHAYDTVPAATNDDSDTPNSGDLSRPSTTTSGGSGLSQFHTVTWASIHMGERLGAGAFGEVFKAAYRGEIVAVKRLSLSPSASDEARQRASAAFRRECETMSRVPPHRNVLALWGVVADDPPAWIAEYCAGGSLDLYVNRKRPSYRHILVMARDIADGVAHLHKHSVVHRDLAARNLLRTDKRVIKVADFGLARESPNDDFVAVDGSASVGNGAGAAKWSAPEAIENGVYTKASDVWSYGIVLWELVSGKKPYSEMMGAAAAVAIVSRRARLERPADDRCTDDLWALMQHCWADKPEDRPTMVEVRDRLALMIADIARTPAV